MKGLISGRSSIAFLPLVGVLSCSPTPEWRPKANSELQQICSALKFFDAERPQNLSGTNIMTGKTLYSNLVTAPHFVNPSLVRILPEHPRWDSAKSVIDPWGVDYRAQRVISTNHQGKDYCEYRILSCGPNRRFEAGSGDDLGYTNRVSFKWDEVRDVY